MASCKTFEEFESSTVVRNLTELETDVRRKGVGNMQRTIHGWSGHDHGPNISVSADRQVATHGNNGEMEGFRGRYEYSKGVHMFEIIWNPGGKKELVIGIATSNTNLTAKQPVIGSDDQSIGWDIITRHIYFNGVATRLYPENGFTIPDQITLILDMNEGTLSFKSHLKFYGVAQIGLKRIATGFHIAAAMKGSGEQLRIKYLGSADLKNPKLQVMKDKTHTDISFHQKCGPNAKIDPTDQYKAFKKDLMENPGKATVLSKLPLVNGQHFQIRISSTVGARRSFLFGATTVSPDDLEFPQNMSMCDQGVTWAYVNNRIIQIHDNQQVELDELNGDLRDLKVGETIAVKLEHDKLQFFINQNRQASIAVDAKVLYGFIDLCGHVAEITVVCEDKFSSANDKTVTKTSNGGTNEDIPLPKTEFEYYDLLTSTASLMRSKSPAPCSENIKAVSSILVRLNRLYKIYIRAFKPKQKRIAADKLAQIDGARVIMTYFNFLKRIRTEGCADADICFHLLREFCFEYSENSLVFCKKLGEVGIIDMCVKDMKNLKDVYQTSKRAENLLKSGMGILTNCAKATENQPVFIECKYMEHAQQYIDPNENPMWACMDTFLTMSYVYEEHEKLLLQMPAAVAERLINCLVYALDDSNLTHGGWSAMEIINGLSNLSANSENVKTFINNNTVTHFLKMTELGNNIEREMALNALWNLITDNNKSTIIKCVGLMDKLSFFEQTGEEHVKNAAKRIRIRLEISDTQMNANWQLRPGTCEYWNLCKRYLSTLNLSEHYFDPDNDRCYCITCHSRRGDRTSYCHGNPKKYYGIPVGWSQFALCPPPKAKALDVFNRWHRAFHGTRQEYIQGILEVGEIVPAGREVIGGKQIKEEPGHYNEARKPAGFDTKQIFLSPSVRYSGVDAYARPSRYEDAPTNTSYMAKVILQVVINPKSYHTGAETIGASGELDPGFSNEEMEWSTNQQGSTILYGVLVKLEKV